MAERRDQPLKPGDATFVPGSTAAPTGPPPSGDLPSSGDLPPSGDRSPEQIHQDIRHTRAEMSETLGEMEEHFHPDNLKDASGGPVASRTPEAEQIQRDIRHTRAEMSETLDELGHRLSPHYIKEQVKDSVRSTAHDAGTSMLDTIKQNPVPSLIAGLSIGWLVMRAGQNDHPDRGYDSRYYRAGYGTGYYGGEYGSRYAGREPYPYRSRYEYDESMADRARHSAHEARERVSDVAGEAQERVSDAAHEARDWAGDVAHEARDWAGDVAHEARDWAGDVAHEAGHRVQETAHDIQRYGRHATNWLEETMERNPLAAGAVAIAAGALVGLAVPETRREHRLMGEASDRVKQQAQHLAEEKLEQVKAVASETSQEVKEGAQEVMSTARDKAQDVARTAEQESQRQGLTSGS